MFIGLSDETLALLKAKLKDPATEAGYKFKLRGETIRIAAQDENWINNCSKEQ